MLREAHFHTILYGKELIKYGCPCAWVIFFKLNMVNMLFVPLVLCISDFMPLCMVEAYVCILAYIVFFVLLGMYFPGI